jgi:predicted HTH transcriptional regulator
MYIKRLIQKGEGLTLDFKHQITDVPKIAKTLVAFANTKGGRLLIGVKDNGRISGMRTEEELYMIESASYRYCIPEVPFEFREHLIEDRVVLEVEIAEGEKKPYYALDTLGKRWSYVRVGDENILANVVLLEVMKRRAQNRPTSIRYTEKEKWLLNYLDLNEHISMKEFQTLAKVRYRVASRILTNLVAVGLVQIVFGRHQPRYKLRETQEAHDQAVFELIP